MKQVWSPPAEMGPPRFGVREMLIWPNELSPKQAPSVPRFTQVCARPAATASGRVGLLNACTMKGDGWFGVPSDLIWDDPFAPQQRTPFLPSMFGPEMIAQV